MTADSLFRLANSMALAGWLLLAVTGLVASCFACHLLADHGSFGAGSAMRSLPGAHSHPLGWPQRWLQFSQWSHVALHRSLAGVSGMGPLSGLRSFHRQLASAGCTAQWSAVYRCPSVFGIDFSLWAHRAAAVFIPGRPCLSWESLAWSSCGHLACTFSGDRRSPDMIGGGLDGQS